MDDGNVYGIKGRNKRCCAHSAPVGTCELAVTMFARMRGLLWRKPNGITLVLAPCHHIHTFGMSHLIDVAFVAGDGRILSVHRAVGRARHLRQRAAVAVIERFSQEGVWFQRGDYLRLGAFQQQCIPQIKNHTKAHIKSKRNLPRVRGAQKTRSCYESMSGL